MYALHRTRAISAHFRIVTIATVVLWTLGAHAQGPVTKSQEARTQSFLNGRGDARALDAARREHQAMAARQLARPMIAQSSNLSAAWTAVGPMQVASQSFGTVTGRVTSLAIDPADLTGNTLYVGTTGGGVWKSVNAAGPVAQVQFTPLTDTLPVFSSGATASLSIGALGMANGVLLAGTGDPNDASDSYYGTGILRSTDGGVTWTLAQQSLDGVAGNHSFLGLSVSGFAFSSANPALVVAGLGQAAEGDIVNAAQTNNAVKGLYYSNDAGATWHMATVMDGSQTVQAASMFSSSGGGNTVTAVVWNAVRKMFYAAVRYHGYYQSADGVTWTRLANQPGAGLTTTACPTNPGTTGSSVCPIFRGALAVQPATGDTFALTVDAANGDQGLYQDLCGLNGSNCASAVPLFANKLNAAPMESGTVKTIVEGDYSLSLAASPSGTDTLLYAGTVDLYRCSLAAGCTLRNTTNSQNGCTTPANVAPSQHAIAVLGGAGGPLLFLGNDGGLWRSTDGVAETGAPCSPSDPSHFQNLNSGLGSLAEVISFAQDPANAATLLAGLGELGTAGTGSVTNSWPQLATGEGGTVAIDQTNSQLWYLSTDAGVNIARCTKGSTCAASDFTTTVIDATQIANDLSAIHAPWLIDPGLDSNMLIGTCRAWRGPATGGSLWSSSNAISRPFAAANAGGCSATFGVVRSLAAGGSLATSTNVQNAGSEVLYAGMSGVNDGGQALGGHLFVTTAANTASNASAWTDAATSTVTNDTADAGRFNPGGFDISSVVADPHDATGRTVYATVMGFAGNGVNAPHVYRSIDAGAHWTNISSNLPNAPANSVVIDPNDANTLYVALDTGVYVTTAVTTCTSGNCWSIYGTALPNAPVVQLAAAAGVTTGDGRTGELRAATYGRGIWTIPLLTASAPAAPAMAINPTTVTYSGQAVGTSSASVTVVVTNSGTAALSVSSVVTSGDFSETDNCAGQTIAQGATCSVQVQFAPTATGPRTGLLTVYGNVSGGQATAALSGTGTVSAAIVLTPLTLIFPSTNVGATSAVQNVTVSNTGGTTATLQTPLINGSFQISANTCGASLAPGTGCTLSIVFAPTTAGTQSGALTVVDSAGTQAASLSGVATNPATDSLSPLSLSFGPQQLSTVSAAQQVTLLNTGDVALTLISAQVTSGDFTVLNGCGNSLNAHSSCALSVSFAPQRVGAQTGGLAVADQFRSQTIVLSGTGLAPPGVSLSPAGGLTFGSVGLGLGSAAQAITLTNNGGATLAIAGVAATGDFSLFAGGSTCGASLAPSAFCTVQVVFAPTATGIRSGTVTFSNNASSSPQTIALTGTGVDFALTPSGATSITVSSGQSATFLLLASSSAGLNGSIAFTCAGVPAHSTCTVNPSSVALGGATPVTVTVATGLTTVRLEPPKMPWTHRIAWAGLLLPFVIFARRRSRSLRSLAFVLLLAGCSIGRTVPSSGTVTPTVVTPSGSYSIVVAASSTGLVRTVNLTVVVP